MPSRSKIRSKLLSDRRVGLHGPKVLKRVTKGRGKDRNKRAYLTRLRHTLPHDSPVLRLQSLDTSGLISKVDAPSAGDHSPSIKTVNITPDRQFGIHGRSSYKGKYARTVKERAVPTLQFNTDSFLDSKGVRDSFKGSAAHTLFTSMREMQGVGEVHSHRSLETVLDQTMRAYSPFDSRGDIKSGVSLHRVNIHAENKRGPSLHSSRKGVAPMIGQAMINLWYRNPDFALKMGEKHKTRTPPAPVVAQPKPPVVTRKRKLDLPESAPKRRAVAVSLHGGREVPVARSISSRRRNWRIK
ncbi:MAG: hypothetical protein AAF431_03785 [Pseudomonadota bacterium]